MVVHFEVVFKEQVTPTLLPVYLDPLLPVYLDALIP
jgi:hypothetical protein